MIPNRIPPDTAPQTAFYIGQVMLCHVLSCQPDQAKMRLSFKVRHFSLSCFHRRWCLKNSYMYTVIFWVVEIKKLVWNSLMLLVVIINFVLTVGNILFASFFPCTVQFQTRSCFRSWESYGSGECSWFYQSGNGCSVKLAVMHRDVFRTAPVLIFF